MANRLRVLVMSFPLNAVFSTPDTVESATAPLTVIIPLVVLVAVVVATTTTACQLAVPAAIVAACTVPQAPREGVTPRVHLCGRCRRDKTGGGLSVRLPRLPTGDISVSPNVYGIDRRKTWGI